MKKAVLFSSLYRLNQAGFRKLKKSVFQDAIQPMQVDATADSYNNNSSA